MVIFRLSILTHLCPVRDRDRQVLHPEHLKRAAWLGTCPPDRPQSERKCWRPRYSGAENLPVPQPEEHRRPRQDVGG